MVIKRIPRQRFLIFFCEHLYFFVILLCYHFNFNLGVLLFYLFNFNAIQQDAEEVLISERIAKIRKDVTDFEEMKKNLNQMICCQLLKV